STAGTAVTVTYTGLPGNQHDWIGIAAAGSPNTSYLAFVYTAGQTSGTAAFVVSTPGLYVARSFTNNTYDLVAESAVFTVCVDVGENLCFVAALSGADQVPPNASTATGSAVFVLDPATL